MKKMDEALAERIREFIRDFQLSEGRSPGIRRIRSELKISTVSVVRRYLLYLEAKGALTRDDDGRIAMPDSLDGGEYTFAPILGRVACGTPIDAVENYRGCYALPERIFGSGEMFMLEAQGDSMIDLGIGPRDLVVVRRRSEAENGQVAVVMTDEYGVTLKRFYKEDGFVRLRAENEAAGYEDILLRDCRVLGVAVKVIKDIR